MNTDIAVRDLHFENHHSIPVAGRATLGIAEERPRLSWWVDAPADWQQKAYEVEVRDAADRSIASLHGPVEGQESLYLPWPGPALEPRQGVVVRVRVRGADGDPSPWSDPHLVERGLTAADWTAVPVSSARPEDPESDRRPSILRREFSVGVGVVRARVHVTAHGLFELELNGQRVGEDALAPGWTVYDQRLRVFTYDVTQRLRAGTNALGAWLGDGWYRGRLGFNGGNRNLYGSDLSLLAQLEIDYADGSRQILATDDQWRSAPSPILFSGIYDGETFDARQVPAGWSEPGFDHSAWEGVSIRERDVSTLVAPDGPPIQHMLTLTPVSVERKEPNRVILDFGQNLVGRLAIRASGIPGETIVMRHAEVLQDGELCVRPLRLAEATDRYTFATDDVESWEPRFTYHGFRYAEVAAPPAVLDALEVEARVYHSAMERTGWFECSDADLNRLHENVLWSMRGNFVDVPTDCPQRDERLGWTGDIQVFAPTAMTLFDATGMLSSWLKDLSAEQWDDGTVPWYVPVVPGREMWTPIRPGAAWGDAAVLTPWDVWFASADRAVLERQWSSAKAWVDLLERRAGEDRLWTGDFQLGDWLDPSAPPDDPAEAMTDRDLVASAYFSWSARHLAKTAQVIGRQGDADHYARLADEVAAAIRNRYLDKDGRLAQESQTGYAMLICMDLVDGDLLAVAGVRLRELVEAADHRIATGFVGTPLISEALTRTGSHDTAYRQLLERGCPSWLYPITQGATTIWERWDSQLEDGTINPGQMTSFNHYALGAVARWMYSTIAGLEPIEPGWRRTRFQPRPGGGLTWARASHQSPYGLVAIEWSLDHGRLSVMTTVPTGATAELVMPDGSKVDLHPGTTTTVSSLALAQ
ncbi:family 78 glycoside hydrolase catalytic domain [Kocuria sp. M1R5S2]|uniref:family 78 glycoside hydrolase catalytic domain n=1 Tax=Kocuria rhizosphaerae TaxID=3376285 RepID=UPI0037A23431